MESVYRESSRPRLLNKTANVWRSVDGDMENITSTNMKIRINVPLIGWGVTPAFNELGKIECNHSFSSFIKMMITKILTP